MYGEDTTLYFYDTWIPKPGIRELVKTFYIFSAGETKTSVSLALGGVAPNNTGSGSPRISADGTRIVFSATSSNLVADDTNNRQDVFSVPNPLLP